MLVSENLSGGGARFRGGFFHFGSLRTFRTLHDFKFNFLAFLQRFIAIAGNGGEVNKTSAPSLRPMKPNPLELLNHFTVPIMSSLRAMRNVQPLQVGGAFTNALTVQSVPQRNAP
jgi:hypothetical protein